MKINVEAREVKDRATMRWNDREMWGVSLRNGKTAVLIRDQTGSANILVDIRRGKTRSWSDHVVRRADKHSVNLELQNGYQRKGRIIGERR